MVMKVMIYCNEWKNLHKHVVQAILWVMFTFKFILATFCIYWIYGFYGRMIIWNEVGVYEGKFVVFVVEWWGSLLFICCWFWRAYELIFWNVWKNDEDVYAYLNGELSGKGWHWCWQVIDFIIKLLGRLFL
jgi:hypothetical protein